MDAAERSVARIMRTQAGVVAHQQALAAGVNRARIQSMLRSGSWIRLHHGVYATPASADSARRRVFAAYLAVGEPVALSHMSAAWMLGLVRLAPDRPHVTVPAGRTPRIEGVVVHRARDYDQAAVREVKGLPCTAVPRTLTDLAGELAEEEQLAGLLDAALARRLATARELEQEIRRRSARGRVGPARLGELLERRGLSGGPPPSVLEAEMLRLLDRWGIPVQAREVVAGEHGRYRVDFVIVPGLVVEVDGFAYHWSPEAKAYDDRRRNQLRAQGLFVLVYSWRDVRFDARRVATEIRAEVAKRAT